MRVFVGVTDSDWVRFLRERPDLDEVSFWQPGGNRVFRVLQPGEPFLLDEDEWIAAPRDWRRQIVQGKTYDTREGEGA